MRSLQAFRHTRVIAVAAVNLVHCIWEESAVGARDRDLFRLCSVRERKIPETVDKCWKTKTQLSNGFGEIRRSEHDDAELELLKAVARQRLVGGQGQLDLGCQ